MVIILIAKGKGEELFFHMAAFGARERSRYKNIARVRCVDVRKADLGIDTQVLIPPWNKTVSSRKGF